MKLDNTIWVYLVETGHNSTDESPVGWPTREDAIVAAEGWWNSRYRQEGERDLVWGVVPTHDTIVEAEPRPGMRVRVRPVAAQGVVLLFPEDASRLLPDIEGGIGALEELDELEDNVAATLRWARALRNRLRVILPNGR